jgi:long-subunit acyl-CoA synthetase (AMP-forming)
MGLDRARRFASGTAPISPAVLDWFHRLGMPISEGWGMTETAGLSCGNIPFVPGHLGTIGVPVACVEMRLADSGEVLIRGDAIFREYYLNPEVTEASFTDGWFHTGDLATRLEDGAWKIVGRIKEQFKTGKGKYVAPVPIESLLASDPIIEQVCVMGSGRRQPLALAVLSSGAVTPEPTVQQQLESLRNQVNSQLESHERLDQILVCADAWSIDNDFLTPTLKLKRDRLETHYAQLLETVTSTDPVVWESAL